MRLIVPVALLVTACTRQAVPERPTASDAAREDEETCVDAWLAKERLDPFGNPAGTPYAGGTPLFDERSGATQPRIAYVYARRPDLARACGAPNGRDAR